MSENQLHIDPRLPEPESQYNLVECFNAVMGIIDELAGGVAVTVTFDSDGGSSVTAQSVMFGAKAEEPDDPTKQSKTFKEWQEVLSTGPSGVAFDFDTPIKKPITLKAIWQ